MLLFLDLLAFPTSNLFKDDQVREELHHLHVSLRRQVQRAQPDRDLRLDSAELVRDGSRKTFHSGSSKGCRIDGEEDLHRRIDQVRLDLNFPI
jgi:hypothetical protein